jgi:hypothetical protein
MSEPIQFSLDDCVEFWRGLYEVSARRAAKYNIVAVGVPMKMDRKSAKLFAEWMMSTTHDAFFHYRMADRVEQITTERLKTIPDHWSYVSVYFVPKGTVDPEEKVNAAANMIFQ